MLTTINQRLILYIILFSSAVTMLMTAVQLFVDYRREIALIEEQFEEVRVSYVPALEASLWELDVAQVETLLKGIYGRRDIQYLSVVADQDTIAEIGTPKTADALQRSLPLKYVHAGETVALGTFQITATLEGVHHRLLDKVAVILATNGIKIFSIACFLYWLFLRLVTRHLTHIADFARGLSHGQPKRLHLHRTRNQGAPPDELEHLVKSLNTMQDNLAQSYQKLAEKEKNYRELVENTGAIILRLNNHGELTFINEFAQEFFGFRKEEILGRHVVGTIVPETDQSGHNLRQLIAQVLEYPDRFTEVENENICRDGRRVWVSWRNRAIKGASGETIEILTVGQDMTERRRTEAELAERSELLEKIMGNLPVMICFINQDGQMTFANREFLRVFETTLETIQNHPDIFSVWYPDPQYRAQVLEFIQQGSGKFAEFESRNERGKIIPTSFANVLLSDGTSIGIGIDITERKKAEQALKERQEIRNLFIEHAPAALAMFDTRMRYLCVSQRWRSNFGLDDRDLIGESHYDIFPEIPPEWREAHHRGLNGEVLRAETDPFVRADGSVQWVRWELRPWYDASGAVGGVVIFSEDISDIKTAQDKLARLNKNLEQEVIARSRKLAESENLYRTLTETAPQVIWLGEPDGRISYVNRAWYELTGLTPETSMGNAWVETLHPDERLQVLAQWEEAVKTGSPNHGECRLRAADGSYRTVSYVATPVRDERGEIVNWVGINTDITERKLAEKELQAANKELEAFTYSVSHDLRAPLRAVSGFAGILRMEHGDALPEEGHRYLEKIQDNARQMGQLIDDLLAFARLGRRGLNKNEVDPALMARQCFQELEGECRDRQVEFRVAEVPPCLADPTLLRQVLRNLASNAVKYTRNRKRATIEFGAVTENGQHCYFIRDNGIGFDMRYADKLFGVFERLHRAEEFEGTGLGLAIVQRVIQRHGGRVWAEAEPGRGAAFFFTLGAPGDAAPKGTASKP